jgi:hypothetical protein
MGKIGYRGEGPSVPRGFLRDLKLIDREYELFWDKKAGRFMVVRPAPYPTFSRGFVCEFLIECKGQYRPPSDMVLTAIKKLLHEKKPGYSFGDHLKELEREREERWARARAKKADGKAQFSKHIMRRVTSKTFT